MSTTAVKTRQAVGYVIAAALAFLGCVSACANGIIGMEGPGADAGAPVAADANRPPPADTAPVDTAPTDAAQSDTAPVDTAPADTARADAAQADAAQADAVLAEDATGCQRVINSFRFDFEDGWQGWATGVLPGNGCETSTEWEQGTPSTVFWPQRCAGGTGCLATDLDDHYNYDECSYARSPALDLTSCVGTPICLKFDLAYDFLVMYGECVDGCVVQVNDTDQADGDNWVTVTPEGDYPSPMPTSHQLPASQRAFCGLSDWASYTVPIGDALKKAAFRVRFYMDNGQVVSHFGAYVDNVRLDECP
jgi:hypothetical protein